MNVRFTALGSGGMINSRKFAGKYLVLFLTECKCRLAQIIRLEKTSGKNSRIVVRCVRNPKKDKLFSYVYDPRQEVLVWDSICPELNRWIKSNQEARARINQKIRRSQRR